MKLYDNPGVCPKCGSEDVDFGDVEFCEEDRCRQDCGCNNCDCRWDEYYEFVKKVIVEDN